LALIYYQHCFFVIFENTGPFDKSRSQAIFVIFNIGFARSFNVARFRLFFNRLLTSWPAWPQYSRIYVYLQYARFFNLERGLF